MTIFRKFLIIKILDKPTNMKISICLFLQHLLWNTVEIHASNGMETVPCEIIRSPADKSIYTVERYRNLTVLYIYDKRRVKSAVSFVINVGNSSDPEKIPGLCHFVEHGFFAGRDGSFEAFVSARGGCTNGNTGTNHTNYFFDINPRYLKEAVKKFLDFFTDPATYFSNDVVDAIINEIDAEFSIKKTNQWVRMYLLLVHLMKKESPLKNSFGYGNKKIFEAIDREELVNAAVNIVKKVYPNARMTLTIQSNWDIEYMRSVAELFQKICKGDVDNNTVTVNNTSNCIIRNLTHELFNENMLSKMFYCKSTTNQKMIRIVTLLPSLTKHARINPLAYIKTILADQNLDQEIGKTIIFNFDTQKNYTLIKMLIPFPSNCSHLSFLSRIYSCINYLRADETVYQRMKIKMDTSFRYKEEKTPMEKVFSIALNAFKYPLEYILSANDLLREYNAEVINQCITSIGDANKWLVFIEDPEFNPAEQKDNTVFVENYCGVQCCFKCSLVGWSAIQIRRTMASEDVGELNEIKVPPVIQGRREMKRRLEEDGELNFVFDSQFETPKVYISITLGSEDVHRKPTVYYLYFCMVGSCLNSSQKGKMKDEGTNIFVNLSREGIIITIEGFSDRVREASDVFFSAIKENNFLKYYTDMNLEPEKTKDSLDKWFNDVKSGVLKDLHRISHQTPHGCTTEKLWMALTDEISAEMKFEITKKLVVEDIKIEQKFFVQMIAVGNGSYSMIGEIFDNIRYKLGAKDVYSSIKIDKRPALIEFGTHDKENNVVRLFYEVNKHRDDLNHAESEGDETLPENQREKKTMIAELITHIVKKMFFNDGRRKNKLGYIVSADTVRLKSAEYISFSIQSTASSEIIKQTILEFVRGIGDIIESMSDKEFEIRKRVVADVYLEPSVNLKQFHGWIVASRSEGCIDLNLRKRLARRIMDLTKADLLNTDIWEFPIEVRSFPVHLTTFD